MLLNLLKTRYVDAPVSMDISSAINSYSVEGDVELGGEIAPVGQGDTFAGVGVTGRYADKPTISYVPLAGVFLIPIGSITLLNFPRFRSQPSGST